MIMIFLKSQLGLFDKLVPVAGSVTKDGVIKKPHFAIRKVRPKDAAKAKPAAASDDLLSAPTAKPERAAGDLFDKRPEPEQAATHYKVVSIEGKRFKHHDGYTVGSGYAIQDTKTGEYAVLGAARMSGEHPTEWGKRSAAESAIKDGLTGKVRTVTSLPDKAIVAGAVDERAPEVDSEASPVPTVGKVDYSKPFDPEAVPSFGVAAGISKERRRAINADGYMLVNSKSEFTPEDMATLRQYSGNGGCGDSLNEFYTDPKVASAMWYAVRAMGAPDGATALEPSCATGVFLDVAPGGTRATGVEMDQTSARIGQILHPAQQVETASLERFAQQDSRQFDVVIGNAPFGLRGSLLKDDKPDLKTAEGYFLDTSLDKAREGGIVAMIVPTGVLDSKRDRKLRERLMRKGEFLGAMRMPNTAFEHSHTGVTSDIVFFRKRPQDVAGALMAVDQKTLKALGVWDDEYLSGEYYTGRGAKNVLGTMTEGWRAKAGMGQDITVEGSMAGVPAAIAEFVAEVPETASPTVANILGAAADEAMRERIRAGAVKKPYEGGKRGDLKTVDGIEYILEGEPLRWHRVDEFMQTKAVTDAEGLAARIEATINGATDDGLAAAVREYVDAHGIPSKNHDLMLAAARDRTLYRLIGAVKPDGSLSDVVEGRKAHVLESSFDAAAQSLALESVWFTPEAVAGRWHDGTSEVVLDHLYASPDYALDPKSGLWTSADQYLSGELWPKLDDAREALAGGDVKPEDRGKFERQAVLLEEAIDPKLLEDVEIMLNSAFLPLNVVAGFFNAKKAEKAADGSTWAAQQPDMTVTFDKGIYSVHGGLFDASLLAKYLNRAGVRKDDLPRIEKWNAEFKQWLCGSAYRDSIEDLYNRKFRGFRQRAYSDTPIEIPGLNSEGLKTYQWSGLRWALEAGKGIVAADVGLGKTARGLLLARAAKMAGNAKRPMIVVPKTMLANWLEEAEKWFPGSSVLTIGETYSRGKDGVLKGKQDTAAERNRKFHDLTQNDYDFILISQPAWNDLDLDPDTKGKYVEDDFWVQRGNAMGNDGDARLKKIRKARESYNQQMASRDFQKRTDAIYFNDLGVDMIIGDEMHAFKNLYAAKNRFGAQPKFLGGQGLSNRALDMNLKARWVREHNNGKNVYGLTATPTKNSPLEIYSMLSHIAPESFEAIGVRNSEEFLDRFCEFKAENVLTTGGAIEEALVTVGFKNLDELREIMRRYIDRKTAEDVGLVLPKRDDRQHLVDMSAEQESVYQDLRELAANSGKKDATGDAHIFSVMDKMGKAAMDLELLDPVAYKGAKSPKYTAAAKEIVDGAKEGGQVVFADNIGVHDKMVDELVRGGTPRDQIAIINAQVAASSSARQNIATAFNAGKIKVVIGNTATMGEGINLQKGTTDIHHMDLPWEPASMQQRNGRGLRQGNFSESVRIHTYLSKGSFDGYRYQSMMAKKDWQELLWNGGNRVENLSREGNISRDDLLVMLSADPDKAREELTKNKTAAEAKFLAQKHTDAADEFVRFQEMKRSYGALKKKDTKSGHRLQVSIDKMRQGLEANKYFKAKHALDSKTPVLVQPETGDAYETGTAFDIPQVEGALHGGGKFVVTAVFPHDATMRVRRYGAADGHEMILDLKDLNRATGFEYDAKAEQAETAKAYEVAAAAKLNTLTGLKDLHGMPSSVVHANYDAIQTQAKAGMKDYKFSTGYGDVGLIDQDGTPVAASEYEARGKLDTHDLMLPTEEHRKKAIDAFLADERGKELRTESVTARRGRSETRTVVRWPGSYGQAVNRWGHIGNNVFGTGFEKDAREVFNREQYAAARHAKTLPDAVMALSKTAIGHSQYGQIVHWPKRALATLWAKAKNDGKLGENMADIIPKSPSGKPALRSDFFTLRESAGSSYGKDHSSMPVHEALASMAAKSGYNDLAAAMIVDGAPSPEAAARELLQLPLVASTVDGLQHIIAKHPDMGARPARDFVDRYSSAKLAAAGTKTLAELAGDFETETPDVDE